MITSVLELTRYKIGNIPWWVVLRNHSLEPLPEEQKWMEQSHPKFLYDDQGPYKQAWPFRVALPRLHHADFADLVSLMTADFMVEQFEIIDIIRDRNTAEFFYQNQNDEWMPESCLFDTKAAARKERSRILKLLQKWAKKQNR